MLRSSSCDHRGADQPRRWFGADRSLFGTDCPFDPQGGPMFIRESLRAIDELELEQDVLDKLMHGNAERLLRLKR